jgi:hypothetical protein
LLPHEPAPSAVDWAPQHKWVAVSIGVGAVMTAALIIFCVVFFASSSRTTFTGGCTTSGVCI